MSADTHGPCDLCPFRDDRATPCVATGDDAPRAADGRAVWCHRIDPARAIWTPGAADALRRATLEALGRPVPAEFPPLVTQAANLVGAAARFVASGLKQATPEQADERLAICRGCDRFVDGRCRECGCKLQYKIIMLSESCPTGKW